MSGHPSDFLPDYSSMRINGHHVPLFRLFARSPWKYVRKDGKPVQCATLSEAIAEAKACVRRILNPEIRAEISAAETVADVLGIASWHEERATRAAQEQQAAFGTIFVRHKPVAVERRRSRI